MQGRLRKASSVEGGRDLDSYDLRVIARISTSIGYLVRRRQRSSKPRSMLGKLVHLMIDLLVISDERRRGRSYQLLML